MTFKEFLGRIKERFYELILECISFNFFMFLMITVIVKSNNIQFVSDIIPIVAGGASLTYKMLKPNQPKN